MRSARRLFLIFLMIGVTACAGRAEKESAPDPSAVVPVAPGAPEPRLNSRELTEEAIADLQNGRSESAREHLVASLELNPNARVAKRLLDQLDADPKTYFSDKSFRYEVEAGDTLAAIADEYLGDWLSFPILARYNGLQNPARIEPGQMLTIPVPKEAPNANRTVAVSSKGLLATPVVATEVDIVEEELVNEEVNEEVKEEVVDVEEVNETLEQAPPAVGEEVSDDEGSLAAELRAIADEEEAYQPEASN